VGIYIDMDFLKTLPERCGDVCRDPSPRSHLGVSEPPEENRTLMSSRPVLDPEAEIGLRSLNDK